MAEVSGRRELIELLRRLAEDLEAGAEVENPTSARLLDAAAALLEDLDGQDDLLSAEEPSWAFVGRLFESSLYYE